MIFAHGTGERGDLPIPFWLFGYLSVLALVGSVIILAFFWKTAKLPNIQEYEIKSPTAQIICATIRWLVRIFSLAVFLFVLFALLFSDLGSTGAGSTIAMVAVFIIFWVGLTLLSGVIGDVWQVISPWNTLALIFDGIRKLFQRLMRSQSSKPANKLKLSDVLAPPSQQTNTWMAVFALFVFLWMELVHPEPTETRLLGLLMFFYTLYLLVGAGIWGRGWLKTADGFALLHRLVGSLGIFQSARILPPFAGTAKLQLKTAETAFVLVFLGSTTFDGVTNTTWWEDFRGGSTGWAAVPLNTLGLICTIVALAVAYFLVMLAAEKLTGKNRLTLTNTFAHSLIPIALAYAVAHYFSFLILEGQDFVRLLSDPLDQGWNLFGTAHFDINFLLVSTDTIAWVQGLSLLIGHLWGVFLAHDRALETWPSGESQHRLANISQIPLVAVMAGYTLLGLFLLLNT